MINRLEPDYPAEFARGEIKLPDTLADVREAGLDNGVLSCNRHRYMSGTSNSAMMLMILINGLMAGPAVSL